MVTIRWFIYVLMLLVGWYSSADYRKHMFLVDGNIKNGKRRDVRKKNINNDSSTKR